MESTVSPPGALHLTPQSEGRRQKPGEAPPHDPPLTRDQIVELLVDGESDLSEVRAYCAALRYDYHELHVRAIVLCLHRKMVRDARAALTARCACYAHPGDDATHKVATNAILEAAATATLVGVDVEWLLVAIERMAAEGAARTGVPSEVGLPIYQSSVVYTRQIAHFAGEFMAMRQPPSSQGPASVNAAVPQTRSREKAGGPRRRSRAARRSSSSSDDDGAGDPPGPGDGSTWQHLALRHVGVERLATSSVATPEGLPR